MIKRDFKPMFVWLVVSIGALLPWVVGIGVKVYLDLKGEPTWDWLYFLNPGILVVEVWSTFWLAAPSIVLGLLAHLMFSGRIPWARPLMRWEQGMIVIASALWGAAGSVPVFIEMFWKFHPISFVVPFLYTWLYVDDYLLGLATGTLLAVVSIGVRRLGR